MINNPDFYYFETIDSTNSEARRKIEEGISLPAVFVAENQTLGRGRRGRSFFSEGGLYMSLAIDTREKDTVLLTSAAAVCVAEAIEETAKIKVGIKWVNDLYLSGKKVCGILCEAVADKDSGEIAAVIIGVGINLNVTEFPDELKNLAGGIISPEISRKKLAEAVTEKLLSYMKNPSDIIGSYKKRSIVLNRNISYEKNGATYFAKALDIDDLGGLVVQNEDGTKTVLNSGEIALRIT